MTASDDRDVEKGSARPDALAPAADSSDASSRSGSESPDPTRFSKVSLVSGLYFKSPAKHPPQWKKIHIVIAGFTCTFNGNLGSSMPSGALDAIAEHFHVTSHTHLVLLNSLYMVGYVLGPLLFAPLSEYVGRRPVLVGTFLGYLVFMLACSAAPTYPALLVFRLLCGVNAAAPTSIIGGLYADIIDDPSVRGNAIAFYMTVTTFGPFIGPIISGFSSPVGWRWPFWIAGLTAVPGLPLVLTLPETYAPVLHNDMVRRRMRKMKKGEVGPEDEQALRPFDLRNIFLRPVTLLFTEPIVLSTSAYLTLVYSVMYLMFQAYPIVFQDFYGLSPGMASLAYIPRECIRFLVLPSSLTRPSSVLGRHHRILHIPLLHLVPRPPGRSGKGMGKQRNISPPPAGLHRFPMVSYLSSPPLNNMLTFPPHSMVISLFWLGWTVWPTISPIIPMLGGVFFPVGMQLLFMGMINYLTDVFRQSSASAHAAASWTRSTGAILLPLVAQPMYRHLGVHWAPSVLGFLALAMGVIPFVFLRYGERLARSSRAAREAYGVRS